MYIECLHRAGAIPYVKTNVPQTLMTFERYNPVYGRTLNPHNHKLFPGGSSGDGESALLAAKGSILGISTDIMDQCVYRHIVAVFTQLSQRKR